MIGYLDERIVTSRLLESEKNIDKLLEVMQYPAQIKNLSKNEKIDALKKHAQYCKERDPRLRYLTVKDVVVLNAWDRESKISDTEIKRVLGDVQKEIKLKLPVARYFSKQGYDIFEEVPIGKSRADLLAFRSSETVAIEVKSKMEALKIALEQLPDYRMGVNKCYLGTTSACIIEYITKFDDPINSEILEGKLRSIGVGFIIIDYTAGLVHKIFAPSYSGKINNELYQQIIDDCKNKRFKPFRFKLVPEEEKWKKEQEKLKQYRGFYEETPKEEEKNKGCFITTACIKAMGLHDDCSELNTLRTFRDNYVKGLPNGERVISEYYSIAPRIVSRINRAKNPHEVYMSLYERLILKSCIFIRYGQEELAFKNYLNIVNELKSEYL